MSCVECSINRDAKDGCRVIRLLETGTAEQPRTKDDRCHRLRLGVEHSCRVEAATKGRVRRWHQYGKICRAGSSWSAVKAGIKASGRPDVSPRCCGCRYDCSGDVYKEPVVAAPVVIGRENIAASEGQVSRCHRERGNANCATGAVGLDAARTYMR